MSSDDVRLDTGEDRAVLHLPPHLGVADGPQLRDACLRAVATGLPVTVDASGVQRIHTAALQCLLALALRLDEQGAGIEWTGTPEVLQDRIDQLGLRPWMGLDLPEA